MCGDLGDPLTARPAKMTYLFNASGTVALPRAGFMKSLSSRSACTAHASLQKEALVSRECCTMLYCTVQFCWHNSRKPQTLQSREESLPHHMSTIVESFKSSQYAQLLRGIDRLAKRHGRPMDCPTVSSLAPCRCP